MTTLAVTNKMEITSYLDIISISLQQLGFLIKLANFLNLRSNVYLIEHQLEQLSSYHHTLDRNKISIDYINRIKRWAKSFRILCVVTIMFFCIYPNLDYKEGNKKVLPLRMWLPFDSGDYYYLVFVTQILSLFFGSLWNSTIDILTMALVTVCAAQIDILRDELSNAVDEINHSLDEKETVKSLRKFVMFFNDIYK